MIATIIAFLLHDFMFSMMCGISTCGAFGPFDPREDPASVALAESPASEPPPKGEPNESVFMPDCLSASSKASSPDDCFKRIPP